MTLTTVNSSGVKNDSIVNADIKSDAAIAGTKIDPDFGSQQIETTGANILCTNGQIQSFGAQNGLHIKRTVTGTSSGYSFFGNNTRTWALEYNSNQFSINDYTAVNVPRIGIDENGYVGIGTADPDRKFHILDAGSAYLRLTNASTSISNGTITGMIEFEHRDSSGAGVAAAIRSEIKDTDTGSATLNFSTGTPSGLGTRMTILPDGKVGIGTEAPTGKLDVIGNANITGKVTIKNTDDSNINVFEVKNDKDNVSGGFSQSSAGDGTLFSKRNDGTLSIFFRSNGESYLNSGNLGIGTTSPANPLEVVNTSGTSTSVFGNRVAHFRSNASGRDAHIAFGDNVNASAAIGYLNPELYFYVAGADRLRIKSGGQICIGTTDGPGEPGLYLGDGTNPAAHIYANGSDHLYILANAYYNGGWKYQGSGHGGSLTIGDGDLVFNTAPTGSAGNAITWAEVFRAKNSNGDLSITNGNLVVAAGKGIDFAAQTGTQESDSATGGTGAELLNHYEEGTWTPTLTSGTGTNTCTYSNQNGYFTRVGNLVHIDFYVNFSNGSFGGSGTRLNGLPFSALNWGAGSVFLHNWNFQDDAANIICHTSGNSTLYLYTTRDNASWQELDNTTSGQIIGACTYRTGAA